MGRQGGMDGATSPQMLMAPYNVVGTYTRDFPYDWRALVENVLDPAHVPFAHHGLQGCRDDAVPISVPRVRVDAQGLSFDFADRTMGRRRTGTALFAAPHLVSYDTRFEGSNATFDLTLLCVPRSEGSSRAILLTTRPRAARPSLAQRVLRRIPTWMVHLATSRFLDSDLIFLHRQDRLARAQPRRQYALPAEADRPIAALRKLFESYGYADTNTRASVPGTREDSTRDDVPRRELLDRWHAHVLDCKHCARAHRRLCAGERWALVVALVAACAGPARFALGTLGVACALRGLRVQFYSVEFQYTDDDVRRS